MANLFSAFKSLIPTEPLLVGTVQVSSGDSHQVSLMGGGTSLVRGKASPGQKVFIKGGAIQGIAPNLPEELIEI